MSDACSCPTCRYLAEQMRDAWEGWLADDESTFPTEELLDAMGDILDHHHLELRCE